MRHTANRLALGVSESFALARRSGRGRARGATPGMPATPKRSASADDDDDDGNAPGPGSHGEVRLQPRFSALSLKLLFRDC